MPRRPGTSPSSTATRPGSIANSRTPIESLPCVPENDVDSLILWRFSVANWEPTGDGWSWRRDDGTRVVVYEVDCFCAARAWEAQLFPGKVECENGVVIIGRHRPAEAAMKAAEEALSEPLSYPALNDRVDGLDPTGRIVNSVCRGCYEGHDWTCECVKSLGFDDNDLPLREERRKFLEDILVHPETNVRDAAASGLSYLDDPRSLPPLERALAAETNAWLRTWLERVIAQLRRETENG